MEPEKHVRRLGVAVALAMVASSAAAQEAPAPSPPAGGFPAVPLAPVAPIVEAKPLEPSSGLLLLLAGSGLTIAGAVNLATSPICTLSTIRASARPVCLGTSIAFGVGLLAGGIPLLVVGAKQRESWKTWKLGAAPTVGGGAMIWAATW